MANVKLKNITKLYENGTKAVNDLCLNIEDGEFVVLVGPSGCGKSTTIRMIAGLEKITDGQIYIDEKQVNYVDPRDRDVSVVFQDYALYPYMTVEENIGFPLKMRKIKKNIIKEKVAILAKKTLP